MRSITKLFKNKKIDYKKLLDYGFKNIDNNYIYKKMITNTFEVNVIINERDSKSFILDIETNEEYILVDVESYTGNFVGEIRTLYEELLKEIVKNCTIKEYYKNTNTKEIITYIKDKYNTTLDYPWNDESGVARNNKNKWYILFMKIPANKLDDFTDEIIEVINIKYQKDKVYEVIDNISIFPAYHMNKKSWITIKLDSEITQEQLFKLIDNSYNLS